MRMKVGDKINMLTMISDITSGTRKHPKALFQCDCGVIKEIDIDSVSNEKTKSCGCYRLGESKKIHGFYGTRIYGIYRKMLDRCKPNYCESQYYYERGITVCDEWKNDFIAFKDWAFANGYTDELTIDRIDVNKGYSPNNCRWATPKQQGRNKRNNIMITHEGKTMCLSEWCEELDLKYETIEMRIIRGWDAEKAITTPIRKLKKYDRCPL